MGEATIDALQKVLKCLSHHHLGFSGCHYVSNPRHASSRVPEIQEANKMTHQAYPGGVAGAAGWPPAASSNVFDVPMLLARASIDRWRTAMTRAQPSQTIVPTHYDPILALCAAAVLVVTLGWATLGAWSRFAGDMLDGLAGRPVYSVAAVRASLARDPQDWSGRVVLVRAALTIDPTRSSCPAGPMSCLITWAPILVDPHSPEPSAGLALAYGAPDPLWVALRRVPLIRSLVPRPQLLRWGQLATYRVRLHAAPGCRAGALALLIDAQGGA